jgi:hypothetical protein
MDVNAAVNEADFHVCNHRAYQRPADEARTLQ